MADDGERRATLDALAQLLEPLNRTLTDPSEIVLHDLRLLPDSIVAIAGSLTGRQVGGRAPEFLLEQVRAGRFEPRVGYWTTVGDVEVRSTLVFVRDASGEPFAAVSIDYDVSLWLSVRAIAEAMIAARDGRFDGGADPRGDDIPGIGELAARLIEQAIGAAGVPVDLMQKRHKLAVVRELRTRSFFTLRDGIETAAEALGVTRFTIYNYLNELDGAPDRDR